MVRAMRPVTDPNILNQLNAKPVTDPNILAQLNAKPEAPSGFLQGLGDIPAGAGQFVPRALEQITSFGGLSPNPISELYGKSAQRGDVYAKQREKGYQEARQASGESGIDWGRIAGNVVNPINYVGGAGIVPTIGRGAGFGALQPVEDTENYGKVKAGQVGVSALGAGIAKGVGDKFIAPAGKRATEVATLLKEKVPLTLGQRAGGLTQAIENKLTSVPLLGDVIKGAQSKSTEGINKAAYARVLNSIGEKPPKDLGTGRNAISYIGEKVGQKYDDLLPKLTGKIDKQFNDDLANLNNMVQVDDIMNAAEKSKYSKIISNAINKRMTTGGITGEAIKDIESELGEKAAKLGAGDVSQRQLADVLKETQSAVRGMVERSNPQYAKELQGINKAYAQLLRVEKAASGIGNESGVFTPSQLQSAVKALDKSKNKRAFARGKALMQDLSEAGKNVLPNSIPNSGTVDRALMFGGLGGLSAYGQSDLPASDLAKYGAIALAPSLLYTSGGVGLQNALAQGLRSKGAQSVLRPIGQTIPYFGAPTAAQLAGK